MVEGDDALKVMATLRTITQLRSRIKPQLAFQFPNSKNGDAVQERRCDGNND